MKHTFILSALFSMAAQYAVCNGLHVYDLLNTFHTQTYNMLSLLPAHIVLSLGFALAMYARQYMLNLRGSEAATPEAVVMPSAPDSLKIGQVIASGAGYAAFRVKALKTPTIGQVLAHLELSNELLLDLI